MKSMKLKVNGSRYSRIEDNKKTTMFVSCVTEPVRYEANNFGITNVSMNEHKIPRKTNFHEREIQGKLKF